jgi:hypothetical protein
LSYARIRQNRTRGDKDPVPAGRWENAIQTKKNKLIKEPTREEEWEEDWDEGWDEGQARQQAGLPDPDPGEE